MHQFQRSKSKVKLVLIAAFALVSLFFVFKVVTADEVNNLSPPVTKEKSTPTTQNKLPSTEFIKPQPKKLRSKSYQVNYPPDCFGIDCHLPNNYHAYEACENDAATNLNILGAKSMERYVGVSSLESPVDYPVQYLREAYDSFKKATEVDPKCLRAKVNLALAHAQLASVDSKRGSDPKLPVELMTTVIEKEKYCRHYAVRGFFQQLLGEFGKAQQDWDQAFVINPKIGEGRYMGIINCNDTRMHRHERPGSLFWETRTPFELTAMLHALLYTEFSPVSVAGYALTLPNAHEDFIKNRYAILHRIIPPFVYAQVSNFYRQSIKEKLINFGDPQSQRYYAGNDRIARYLHYALTDLIRKVVAHNVIPTYTYFGGYVGGAELTPHTDRHACEFTMSLTLYQDPPDEPWDLGLGKKPLFERDDETAGGAFPLPPEDEQVKAPLHEGDALLFMGRHLVHWRYGQQKEGHSTYNVFLHYVQNDFKRWLD
jgi:tetratricopeptide (TPR) repeat protein